jgi:hypothetical protein
MGMQQEIKRSHYLRNFSLAFLPAIFLVSVMSFYVYNAETRSDLHIVKAREVDQLNLQRSIISGDFNAVADDLMMMSKLSELQKLFVASVRDMRGLENDLLAVSKAKKRYDQIRYLDEVGMEVVRVNFNKGQPLVVPANELQSKAQRYYFRDTIELNRDDIFISPLDLNIEHGRIEQPLKPMIRFGTPVLDKNGEKRGVLILNYLANILFEKMQRFSLNEQNNFSFLNSEGYWLKGDGPDEWGFMYENKRDLTFGNEHPLEWQEILSSDYGQFDSDKGLFAYTTVYPLTENLLSSNGSDRAYEQSTEKLAGREYFFKIVSHVPKAVLEKISGKVFKRLIPLYLMTVLIIFVGSWRFANLKAVRDQAWLEREALIKDLEASLSEVKTLRGLIPICSSCKKIRDDAGIWNRIESYISARTEAEFSHGMCNDCIRELYPEVADEVLARAKMRTE